MTYARRMICIRCAFVFLSGSTAAGEASAQFSASETDRRVRLHFADPARPALVARFIEFRHDTVVVQTDQAAHPTAFVAAELKRVERWERRRHTPEGALLGGLTGGVTGFIVGSREAEKHRCESEQTFCFEELAGLSIVLTTVGLALIGTVVGAGVGTLIRTQGWTEMRVPTRVAIAPAAGGRVAIRATVPIGGAGR